MTPYEYDLTIYQGATFRLQFYWRDSDEVGIDLSGYTARMQVRASVRATTTMLELTTENGGITLGNDGGVLLFLSDEATAALTRRSGVYDLELEAGDGTVTRLLQGSVEISPEVTR